VDRDESHGKYWPVAVVRVTVVVVLALFVTTVLGVEKVYVVGE
jgi:hypothetical protein